MPKFSIIVPVYNVEDYITKCLDSILSQSFKDYEVIVVNDGTKDKSIEKIKDYPVKIINQKNQGVSVARNNGVKSATGDYLIFVDSDDFLEKDLLKNINASLKNSPDLVRFQFQEVYPDGTKKQYPELPFEDKTGVEAFNLITNYHIVDAACGYAIKRSYYLKENFSFKKGTLHEDYGLIPLIIIKAEKVNSISYIGYNYFQRPGSTMNSFEPKKQKRKFLDMYTHYHFLIKEIDKTNLDSKVFKSFLANSLILKLCSLDSKNYHEYFKKLKEDHVFNNLLVDTKSRKIKKVLLKISPKLYYKVLGR